MTSAIQSPVTRETAALSRRRPLIVTIQPYTLVMREKGRRLRVEVSIDAIYSLGMKQLAEAARRERAANRRARR